VKPENLIYLLIEIALVIAIFAVISASIKFAYGADMNCATRPGDRSSWWSYRLVDGRQCWYRGKDKVARERLHWGHVIVTPTGSSVAGQPDVQPSAELGIEAAPASGFESEWRTMIRELNAANITPWLNPTPVKQWSTPLWLKR